MGREGRVELCLAGRYSYGVGYKLHSDWDSDSDNGLTDETSKMTSGRLIRSSQDWRGDGRKKASFNR